MEDHSRPETTVGPVRAVVLAAGAATRLGRAKALLEWRGKPLLQHVLDTVEASRLDGGVVVLGARAETIRQAVTLPEGVAVTVNPEYSSGQASSLRWGFESLTSDTAAAVVLLGDQPTLDPTAIDAVVTRHREGSGPVVRARYEKGGSAHPVLFDRQVWGFLTTLAGDTGARPVLARHPDWIHEVSVAGQAPDDVDTWEDYQRLIGE